MSMRARDEGLKKEELAEKYHKELAELKKDRRCHAGVTQGSDAMLLCLSSQWISEHRLHAVWHSWLI